MNELSQGQELAKQLLMDDRNGVEKVGAEEIYQADLFCENYKQFLDCGKTEREVAAQVTAMLQQNGYRPFVSQTAYQPGDKVFLNNRGKAIIACTIGRQPVSAGVHIAAAHVDSPRLDLKQRPLYEEKDLALFKTHYYGGIKKYQWTAIPLALHGVIVKQSGEVVPVCVGESADDPVFCVTDLLPHLAAEQMKRTLGDGVKGEELNILIGSRPFLDDKVSEKVKLNIMQILAQKYGITERDFLSAELEMVPAFKAQDVGFDRSMIGAYGHDDRVCAYTALMAEMAAQSPEYTTVTILADKEETGSDGNTGLNSSYLKYFVADLAACFGANGRDVLSHSRCLSADVNAAYDPTFPDVTEPMNTAYLNRGVVVTKFTGSRGKGGTSDASAEYVGYVRRLLEQENVLWQTGELGKVDAGGGGTVALYIANLNVDVIDVGVPVLSMHAPFEVVSKLDVYMAYRAFRAFYK
ncbi:aminopeptidase [Acetanaerobacterium sp. MSJ-12]|nr:aminopeptidase [Acetanaerobacterium sp. MSJ-12]MBU5419296.1 aminopeptidase [Acetanaerobacterium sp. MSJ-12]